MKQLIRITGILLIGLFTGSGCVKVDNDTYAPDNSTTNVYNGPGNNGNGTNNTNGNTNSILNVNVSFNGTMVGGMNLYQFTNSATLKFDWNTLPTDCSQMQITIYAYDKANGANWTYLPAGRIQKNYVMTDRTASIELPLNSIPFNQEMVVGWHIVPICSNSNIKAGEGNFFAIRK